MGSAEEAVCTLPELLELIFFHLDARDLLVTITRVCRQWKAVVDNSGSIQRQLFFQARTGPWNDIESNFLLMDVFPVRIAPYGQGRIKQIRSVRTSTLKNYLRVVSGDRSTWESDDRFTRPEASWRRMLVCQPIFEQNPRGEAVPFRRKAKEPPVFLPELLTLGSIYQAAREVMPENKGPFGVRLTWKYHVKSMEIQADAKDLAASFGAGTVSMATDEWTTTGYLKPGNLRVRN